MSEAPYPHIIHIYRKEKKKGEKRGRFYYCNSTLYIITDGGNREREKHRMTLYVQDTQEDAAKTYITPFSLFIIVASIYFIMVDDDGNDDDGYERGGRGERCS